MHKIDDKSFLNSDINNFLYCGNEVVEGNFLLNAKSINNITVYKLYPQKTIGGVKFERTKNCPNLPVITNGLTILHISLIVVSCATVICALSIFIYKYHKAHKSQKRIEDKMLIQRLVTEDFG
ncbi:hypothetical protein TVAG_359490 [Trichomonas vaginalis G3]|uniref:Uncharacterized protein n=1 Tax=Trichomonas vaginalis (strain ATCC PRA-98 / G3) TaxID=412133 RepID=A2DT68_TRIV3|nr:MyD88-dependent toll-like receptor signaling pathway [Trichomonas vaginalis G3]EAY16340.1 hypothetical protein TVAG_359490 [Trichomonas vaginalis G3]KAI5488434.1 MyD88-dependent toll-like receptor signaling pathway [Trichomonas vaginalis G3]|eukprot:XP_001328563.1 hypothetical protein [Trichomonas vaginalis G3]